MLCLHAHTLTLLWPQEYYRILTDFFFFSQRRSDGAPDDVRLRLLNYFLKLNAITLEEVHIPFEWTNDPLKVESWRFPFQKKQFIVCHHRCLCSGGVTKASRPLPLTMARACEMAFMLTLDSKLIAWKVFNVMAYVAIFEANKHCLLKRKVHGS